jgi:hypothetical protein
VVLPASHRNSQSQPQTGGISRLERLPVKTPPDSQKISIVPPQDITRWIPDSNHHRRKFPTHTRGTALPLRLTHTTITTRRDRLLPQRTRRRRRHRTILPTLHRRTLATEAAVHRTSTTDARATPIILPPHRNDPTIRNTPAIRSHPRHHHTTAHQAIIHRVRRRPLRR